MRRGTEERAAGASGPPRRYPWHDDPDYDPALHRRTPGAVPPPWQAAAPPSERPEPATTRTAPPADPPTERIPPASDEPPTPPLPRKITVTRVAAMRSKQITQNGIRAWHRATRADGADRSGLTALTYTNMADYAVDAAVAVALANTLFFAAAAAESKTNVALYLAITVAPFALVAPVIGPLLDRLQRGRRAAMAVSFALRGVLAVVMALNYDSWVLYPAALGAMVASKSCTVLKAAVTPRVLPDAITLVTTNSRLTVFGLVSAAVFGAIAGGVSYLFGSPGALWFTAALCVAGIAACLRIPRWVESTEGEVPTELHTAAHRKGRAALGRPVVVALWGNGAIRVLTGFLTLFVAFVVKSQPGMDATHQLTLIGIVGAAAGIGAFVGNGVGSRMRFERSLPERASGTERSLPERADSTERSLPERADSTERSLPERASSTERSLPERADGTARGLPEQVAGTDHTLRVVVGCIAAGVAVSIVAALAPGIVTAAVVGLVAATVSALAKVCLDAVIQRDLPEESRASAFGRSETVLQLAWVFGGALGVLLPHDGFTLGFAIVAGVVGLAGVQTALVGYDRSLLPFLRHRAPDAAQAPTSQVGG